MVNVRKQSPTRRQTRAVLPSVLALMLGVCAPMAAQAAAPSNSGSQPALPPQITKLLQDADAALKGGNTNLALIQLKNAVRLAPQAGDARAKLGMVLFQTGEFVAAERELRQARNDHASEDFVVPLIMQTMLARNENKELLEEFPNPPDNSQDKGAAEILKSRASAMQALGQAAEAKASMDRALRLRRDVSFLVDAARLAQEQGDLPTARRLTQEATKIAPLNDDVLAITTIVLQLMGQNANALVGVDDFLKRVPQSNLAKILRIDVLLEAHQDAKAQEQIDEFLKQAPNSQYAKYYRGVLLSRRNDVKGAWQEMQSLRPEFVQSAPSIAVKVASAAAANGNLETSGGILTTLLARHPEYGSARLQLASLRLAQKLPNQALEVLMPFKSSNDPNVQAVFAQVYLQLRRYDEAVASLQLATAMPNANDLLKRQLALSELQVGETSQAIEELQGILRRDPENPQLASPLIAALVRIEKYDDALRIIDRLDKSPNKGPMPALFRGQVLAARGDLPGATRAYGQALAISPKFIPALYLRANLQAQRGNLDEANKDLQDLLAQDPNNMLAYVRSAEIALAKQQDTQAIALLDKAIKAAPTNPVPRLALANLQISRAKYQEAQAVVTDLLQMSPNNPEGLALKGQIDFARGANVNAVTSFRTLVSLNPQSATANVLLSRALNATKDQVGAEDAAKKAVELNPMATSTRLNLIELQFEAGKDENALATARAFAAAYPGPATDLVVADTLVRAKRVNEAIAFLEKSVAAKPDSRTVSRLSQVVMNSGNVKKAGTILSDWLAKNPNDTFIHVQYGGFLMSTGDDAGARREYELVLKQTPENPLILNNLGWLIQKDDPARAMTLVSLAAKMSPRSSSISDTLGWLKLQRRDNQGALPLFQRAHAMDPNSGPIAYHLALALDANGKRADAKTLLQSTLAKNPKFDGAEDAKRILARW
ncbi:MAG TPA: XrtA/PEP-CTERM system TPR-repeat protein PrsT [Micropepsaceae bacterium]|nr:XrtA/PEP-CTERM system TPR-repeat protein PrsT [Micropepsaceae bacterium]